MKKTSKKISIDKADELKGELGTSKEKLVERIYLKGDERFSDLWSCIIFSWKEQPGGKKKIMSRLPNGKILFLDWSENEDEIKIDSPYICVVYEPETNPDGTLARQAYARIICEEYMPKITVHKDGVVHMIWKDQKGNTRHTMPGIKYNSFGERLTDAVKQMENKGFEEVRLVFLKNKN